MEAPYVYIVRLTLVVAEALGDTPDAWATLIEWALHKNRCVGRRRPARLAPRTGRMVRNDSPWSFVLAPMTKRVTARFLAQKRPVL